MIIDQQELARLTEWEGSIGQPVASTAGHCQLDPRVDLHLLRGRQTLRVVQRTGNSPDRALLLEYCSPPSRWVFRGPWWRDRVRWRSRACSWPRLTTCWARAVWGHGDRDDHGQLGKRHQFRITDSRLRVEHGARRPRARGAAGYTRADMADQLSGAAAFLGSFGTATIANYAGRPVIPPRKDSTNAGFSSRSPGAPSRTTRPPPST